MLDVDEWRFKQRQIKVTVIAVSAREITKHMQISFLMCLFFFSKIYRNPLPVHCKFYYLQAFCWFAFDVKGIY